MKREGHTFLAYWAKLQKTVAFERDKSHVRAPCASGSFLAFCDQGQEVFRQFAKKMENKVTVWYIEFFFAKISLTEWPSG